MNATPAPSGTTHNVYLPGDLGIRAKWANLNLSRILRDGVEAELVHLAALNEIDAEEYEVELETGDGDPYTGRIVGEQLTEDLYLTEDGRLLWHDSKRAQVIGDLLIDPTWNVNDIENENDRLAVAHRLGLKAVINL